MINRQPSGIPIGGQYAPGARARAAIALGAGPGPSSGAGRGGMPQPDFAQAGNGTYARPGKGEKGRLAAALAQDDAPMFPGSGATYPGLNTRFGMYAKQTLPELREMAAARRVRPLSADAPAAPSDGNPPPSSETVDRDLLARNAERSLGAALNTISAAEGPSGDSQTSYFRGMQFADICAAASFHNPHDEAARGQINMSIQMAIYRGARNTGGSRGEIMAQVADLGSRRPVTRATADEQMDQMLGAAAITHAESGPHIDGSKKSPHQAEQLGMRNGFAYAAARWANPDTSDHVRTSDSITAALNDGITDTAELRKVATGNLGRDGNGNWVDPYAYLDDLYGPDTDD